MGSQVGKGCQYGKGAGEETIHDPKPLLGKIEAVLESDEGRVTRVTSARDPLDGNPE